MADVNGRQGAGGPEIRPGDVLLRSFRLLIGHPGAFAFVALFFSLLERLVFGLFGTSEEQVSALIYGGGLATETGPAELFALWPVGIGFLICYCVQQGAFTALALDGLAGRPVDFATSLLASWVRTVPLVLVGLSYFLGMFGIISVALLPVAVAKGLLMVSVPAALILSSIYSATFFVIYPATVDGNRGVAASFRTSAALTRGQRWRVFGIYLAGSTAALFVLMLTGSGLSAISLAAGAGGVVHYFSDLALSLIGALAAAWLCCLAAVVYRDLQSPGRLGRQDPAIFD
jgi:hypothetical protein